MARGELNGVQYSTQLSAGDCFELGRQSYHNKDYYHTVLWMTEAMERYHEEINKTTTKSDILEYLAFSTYMQGNIRRALQMTNELLEILPDHERAQGNKVYYEETLQQTKEQKRKGDDGDEAIAESPPNKKHYKGRGMYEKLCRNEVSLSESVKARLKCRYVDFGRPFLKLARLKEEEAFLDPRILLYHDVIHDDEIETLRRMATPRFKRATVQNSETGKLEIAHYRYIPLPEHDYKKMELFRYLKRIKLFHMHSSKAVLYSACDSLHAITAVCLSCTVKVLLALFFDSACFKKLLPGAYS